MAIENEKLLNLEDAQVLYNDLRDRHEDLADDVSVLEPSATSSDVGKYMKVKSVADGKVTEYEFGSGGGGGGTDDYTDLDNKPQINSTTLSGNKTGSDLGLLDAPSTAGTLGQVLTSDGQGGQSWQSGGGVVSIISPASGSTFTLQPCPVTYAFGEKAELTVTVTATSQYHFSFSCPSGTATVLTITGETGRAGDTIEAGKTYEVDVWNGISLVKAVEVTPVT